MVMKKYSRVILLFVMMFIITTHTILNVNTVTATGITNVSSNRQEGLSKVELVGLTAASALSPGISLLRVAYRAQEKGANIQQDLFILFWLVAIFDFLLDKIPGLASLFQFIQYVIIWATAYLGSTYLGGDPLIWFMVASGSIVQIIRQFYTVGSDATIVAAPIRSLFEDLVAALALPLS
nr:hypothetical protein [Nostoc sp. EkiNYC01]